MKWELIKAEIKSISQQFTKTAQLKKYNDSHALRSTLETIEKEFMIDPKNRTIQEEKLKLQKKLELMEMEKTKGAQIRTGIKDTSVPYSAKYPFHRFNT